MTYDSTRKGQLLAVTLFLSLFILVGTVLLLSGETKDFVPILMILVFTIDSIYVTKIVQMKIAKRSRLLWIVLILLFNIFALPFFWKKYL